MMINRKTIQLFLHHFLLFSVCSSLDTDRISSGIILRDPDTITSPGQVFQLGFFTPDTTANRYLAVFHTSSQNAAVWIANRASPLNDSTSTATISTDGNLVLLNGRNQTVWSTNATSSPTNTTLQILDTGDLLLRDAATGATIWESFSHPSDCFLPTMRMIDNLITGEKVVTSSWKNSTDPEVGNFTGGLEFLPIPQYYNWRNGRPFWRSGQWNGLFFIGIKSMYDSYLDVFRVIDDKTGTPYFTAPQGKSLMKICLNSTGNIVQGLWDDQKKSWRTVWAAPDNECDFYGKCGAFGSCNARNSPICSCFRGFEPVDGDEWGKGNWSSGCKRRNPLLCSSTGGNGDVFFRMQFAKVPDFAEQLPSGREDECLRRCLSNCSCVAYAHESRLGCMFWSGSLIDTQIFGGVGVDLYIRVPPSELDKHKDRKLYIIIPVVAGFASVSILAFISWCWIVKRRGNKRSFKAGQKNSSDSETVVLKDESEKVNIEQLPLFTFETLAAATNQFHQNNLLGRGGFGLVYKGNLEDGMETAVKRLSEASRQGVKEFMNEVVVISKLQHRNLVRLLGCCAEKEEKMLVYEYMPNKSLDVCLFDPTHPSQTLLQWPKRFSIIEGIGRGLLYLHRDSRHRIIHRDLKPSNVLLDEDWNPKISDFGMARIVGGNQDHDNTARVVGTYGYMAPEYAMEGRFSEKSDVYSFGVLILEIVKGKKNSHYYNHEWSLSLLGSAWKLWSENNSFAIVDESIASVDFQEEIDRCIQIALLCVQEHPSDRPTIQTVLAMLSREIVELPAPEQPVFAEKGNGTTTGSTRPANGGGDSVNELSLTVLDGR